MVVMLVFGARAARYYRPFVGHGGGHGHGQKWEMECVGRMMWFVAATSPPFSPKIHLSPTLFPAILGSLEATNNTTSKVTVSFKRKKAPTTTTSYFTFTIHQSTTRINHRTTLAVLQQYHLSIRRTR
jgi:hypothetical protein